MARVTVEDCIDKVDSPYELVLVAKERATQLNSGIEPTIDRDNDKNTVIALREIAQETLKANELKNDLIEEYQTNTFTEDDEINEITDENLNTDDELVLESSKLEDDKSIEENTIKEEENAEEETSQEATKAESSDLSTDNSD